MPIQPLGPGVDGSIKSCCFIHRKCRLPAIVSRGAQDHPPARAAILVSEFRLSKVAELWYGPREFLNGLIGTAEMALRAHPQPHRRAEESLFRGDGNSRRARTPRTQTLMFAVEVSRSGNNVQAFRPIDFFRLGVVHRRVRDE